MEYREALTFDDVSLVPRFSNLKSRKDADVKSCGYSLPLAMTPMDLITTPEMIKCFLENDLLASVHRYFKNVEDQFNFIVNSPSLKMVDKGSIYFAIGSIHKYDKWINYLYDMGVRRYLIDMAHGDTQACIDTIRYLKKRNESCSVIAGNICTKSGFDRLQSAGADFIRCGVGSGQCCETRTATGFGIPQFTALQECASRKSTAKLIACGGIKYNGDMVKAMAAGADLCMCGKLFAGTDLAGGECYDRDKHIVSVSRTLMCPGISIYGDRYEPPSEHILSEEDYRRRVHTHTRYKEYYGMASKKARASVMSSGSVEGVDGLVHYTGKTQDLLDEIKLNLQAALSYNGSRNWDDFKRTVKIVKVSNSSILEAQTHVEKF